MRLLKRVLAGLRLLERLGLLQALLRRFVGRLAASDMGVKQGAFVHPVWGIDCKNIVRPILAHSAGDAIYPPDETRGVKNRCDPSRS